MTSASQKTKTYEKKQTEDIKQQKQRTQNSKTKNSK
jgi:hypothetical protein